MIRTIRDEIQRIENRIMAGGPGSGCQGPNCGRPSTGASDSRAKFGLRPQTGVGNKVDTVMRNLGYKRAGGPHTADYEHPEGHRAHFTDSFRGGHLTVHPEGVSDSRSDHLADVEMALHEARLHR